MSNKYLDLDGAKYMLQKYHDKVSNNSQLSNPFDSAPINTVMHSSGGNIFGDKWIAWNETRPLNEFDKDFVGIVKNSSVDRGYSYNGTVNFGNRTRSIKVKYKYKDKPATLYFFTCSGTGSDSKNYNLRLFMHYYTNDTDYNNGRLSWSTNSVYLYDLCEEFTSESGYIPSITDMCWYDNHLYVIMSNSIYKIGFNNYMNASSLNKIQIPVSSNLRHICSSNDKIIFTVYDSTLVAVKFYTSTDGTNFALSNLTADTGSPINYIPERDCFIWHSAKQIDNYIHSVLYELKNSDFNLKTKSIKYNITSNGYSSYNPVIYDKIINNYVYTNGRVIYSYSIDNDELIIVRDVYGGYNSYYVNYGCHSIGGNVIYCVEGNSSTYINSFKIADNGYHYISEQWIDNKWVEYNDNNSLSNLFVDSDDNIMILSGYDSTDNRYIYSIYNLYGAVPDGFEYGYQKYK